MTTSAATILESLGPGYRDTGRRGLLLKQAELNGIDFIEFEEQEVGGPPPAPEVRHHILHVHFLHDIPGATDPNPAYDLPGNPTQVLVHGGTRIAGIAVTKVTPSSTDANLLDVEVDAQGDFSPYLLTIGWKQQPDGNWSYNFAEIDRLFSVAPVNFRPNCPVDFDCAPISDCPPDGLDEPALDYLARDYASFRQMLIDLVAQRNPAWTERSPADIGMALLELFAYEGDHLSYFQDAVANEAFLDTARQRVSAKRHAKLVDYDMHDGRNAWTYVHLAVKPGTPAGTLPPGAQLVTRITSSMRFDRIPNQTPVPQPTVPPTSRLHFVSDEDYRTDPALAQVRVFETTTTISVDPRNNDLRIHAWGNPECCLRRGATTAYVYAVDALGTTAVRAPLKKGDYLLLEEVRGPQTGATADADPRHRQVVRIERIDPDPAAANPLYDKLFLAAIDPKTDLAKPFDAAPVGSPRLPLVEVTWRKEDAMTFPLCVSTKLKDGGVEPRVSVARGNLVLADHGRTVRKRAEKIDTSQPIYDKEEIDPELSGKRTFRLRLDEGPQTVQCQPDPDPTGLQFPPIRERPDLDLDVHESRTGLALRPAVALDTAAGGWLPVVDLLSSTEFERHFVVDVDDEQRAVLRFGDGEYGQAFSNVAEVDIWYRVGNGREGNIGADSLAHLVVPWEAPNWPTITGVRNPLPAEGGVDPELIEQVRQYAPAAFRATQLRAVTEQDYKERALTLSGVVGAVASFRWTGSWYTVFIGIDPADPENVLTDARGVTRLKDEFKKQVLESLTRYRLAGYDLEIRSARYIPLDVTIEICARSGYFRGDVAHAVSVALGAGIGRGGSRGLFDPANFTFGQPVYLSRIYAAVENVEGVESATVTVFHPHGRNPGGELERGSIAIGTWEIARLDNDPSNRENGTLTIAARGGS